MKLTRKELSSIIGVTENNLPPLMSKKIINEDKGFFDIEDIKSYISYIKSKKDDELKKIKIEKEKVLLLNAQLQNKDFIEELQNNIYSDIIVEMSSFFASFKKEIKNNNVKNETDKILKQLDILFEANYKKIGDKNVK